MHTGAARERGFALILAVLALMLLTFLGLTLSTTTSTELQIATNYRWSQQALYNAEAWIEAGKIVLRAIPDDWSKVLPPRRAAAWTPGSAPRCPGAPGCTAPNTTASLRNWELADCDSWAGVGYGVILDDSVILGALNGGQAKAGPYQDVASFRGQQVRGTFTLWVRRDLEAPTSSTLGDDPGTPPTNAVSTLVLTAEGTAPRVSAGDPNGLARRAVRVLQVKLTRADAVQTACDSAEGQQGATAAGANFGACAPLGAGGLGQLSAGGGTQADTGVK